MSKEENLDVLGILKLALEKEKGSFITLSKGASVCSEKRLKRTLNRLALEELKHIIMLMDLSQLCPVDPLGEVDFSFPSPERHGPEMDTEESALSASMSSEIESITLYMELVGRAQEQEDDDVLRLLQQLVEEEEVHKKRLEEMLQRRLKEI